MSYVLVSLMTEGDAATQGSDAFAESNERPVPYPSFARTRNIGPATGNTTLPADGFTKSANEM